MMSWTEPSAPISTRDTPSRSEIGENPLGGVAAPCWAWAPPASSTAPPVARAVDSRRLRVVDGRLALVAAGMMDISRRFTTSIRPSGPPGSKARSMPGIPPELRIGLTSSRSGLKNNPAEPRVETIRFPACHPLQHGPHAVCFSHRAARFYRSSSPPGRQGTSALGPRSSRGVGIRAVNPISSSCWRNSE